MSLVKYSTIEDFVLSNNLICNILEIKTAKNDGKIKTDNVFMAVRIFYALVIGAITWPVLFTDGLNKETVKPVLSEVIAVFLARYGNTI